MTLTPIPVAQPEDFRDLAEWIASLPKKSRKYSPDQPRDERGRFGETEGVGSAVAVGIARPGFGPLGAPYRVSLSELPDKVYHVAPPGEHDSIAKTGLDASGNSWNWALSQVDRQAGGHWNPETQSYEGPGSEDFGYRPEGVYVFADGQVAADYAKFASERELSEQFPYGIRPISTPWEVWEIDVQALDRLPSDQQPDVLRNPESIQMAHLDDRDNEEPPRSSDQIFTDLESADYMGEGERDQREWVFDHVSSEHVRSVQSYELKDQSDWDENDYEEYLDDHPEEFGKSRKFSEDQPRDDHGRFSPEGGSYDRSGLPTLEHPDVLYHVTDPGHRESIQSSGLRGAEFGEGDPNPAGNYFREPDTEYFQQDLKYPGYDIWKVDVRGLLLEADNSDSDNSWFTDAAVPPERLELVRAGSKSKEFNEEDHPRDEHGRFTSGGGSGPDQIAGFGVGDTVSIGGRVGTIESFVTTPFSGGGLEARITVPGGAGLVNVVPFDKTGPLQELDHAIVLDREDGSGRTYAVTWGEGTEAWMSRVAMGLLARDHYLEQATTQLEAMVDRNHELELDTGLTNAWNGEMHLGIDSGSAQSGAIGTKDWDCSINFDPDYMARVERGVTEAGWNGEIPDYWGVTPAAAAMDYSHELAHGLSTATVPEIYEPQVYGDGTYPAFSQADAYFDHPALEEGVVQGYVEAFAQVERFGPDQNYLASAPGSGAYHTWVLGIDEGFLQPYDTERVPTTGERLDYYRDLITTPLPDRQDKINEYLASSGYELTLTGEGLGTKMGYEFRQTEAPPMPEPITPQVPQKARDEQSIHDLIFTAETPEHARAIYEQVQAYLATDPDDYLEVARDAEALVMFMTAATPTAKAKYAPDQPRDHGRFAEVEGSGGMDAGEAMELLVGNSCSSVDEVRAAIAATGAEQIDFPGSLDQHPIWITQGDNPQVIVWDGTDDYTDVQEAHEWLWAQDVTDYYPNADQQWSDDFWSQPQTLYHGTSEENLPSIMQEGLQERNVTRGMSNAYEGAAVYTTTESSEAEYYYGPTIEIDTAAMARDGVTPFVNQEPDVFENDLRSALSDSIGLYDYSGDIEGGMSSTTVVVQGAIPPQYLTVLPTEGGKSLKYSEDEPRDDHGRWTTGGGDSTAVEDMRSPTSIDEMRGDHAGTPEDPVPCGPDIERAALLISEGYHVTLDQPEQVATLLDKMQEQVAEAKAAGKDAPNYDLCDVSVEGTNLFCQDNIGIDRVNMPQLVTDHPIPGSVADSLPRNQFGEVNMSADFAEYLNSSGRPAVEEMVDASTLRASQAELNGVKVAKIADMIASGEYDQNLGRIWITTDNYVIDGHHRWAATVSEQYRTGETTMIPAYRLDMDIGTALTTATWWSAEQGISGSAATDMGGVERKMFETLLKLALVDLDAKFSEDQPRDEWGRFTEGGLAVVERIDPSARIPEERVLPTHGLSEKATRLVYKRLDEAGITHGALVDEIKGRIGGMDAAVMKEAEGWYPQAHQDAADMATASGGKFNEEQAAAVIAALSPQLQWEANLETAQKLCEFYTDGKTAGLSAEDAAIAFRNAQPEGEGLQAFGDGLVIGFQVLDGADIDQTLGGLKVRSFYDNIVEPGSTDEVTIDGHMTKAFAAVGEVDEHGPFPSASSLLGIDSKTEAKGQFTSVGYIGISNAVRAVADAWHVSPDTVQAAYWLQVRDAEWEDMKP